MCFFLPNQVMVSNFWSFWWFLQFLGDLSLSNLHFMNTYEKWQTIRFFCTKLGVAIAFHYFTVLFRGKTTDSLVPSIWAVVETQYLQKNLQKGGDRHSESKGKVKWEPFKHSKQNEKSHFQVTLNFVFWVEGLAQRNGCIMTKFWDKM